MRLSPRRLSPRRLWLLAGLLLSTGTIAASARAHDIPDEIVLQGFVKPANDRLELLVRIPLIMLLNLNLPKQGTGFLDLEHIDDGLQRAATATARELLLYEDGEQISHARVRTRISPPSDKSFATFDMALANIEGPPLSPQTQVFWNQGYFDARFTYPIDSDQADFALELKVAPGLKERLKLIVRYLGTGDVSRAYELHVGSGPVSLDPSWHRAAWTFVQLGYTHILDGVDHLLFLLCLVAPFRLRHLGNLVAVITSFTVAHSFTLLAAAFGLVPQSTWFPPLVELVIAGSIIYLAIENVVGASLRHRWWICGAFGLVHGFGFSFALQQSLQLAGSHLTLSLLAFNVGVEMGQLVFLLVCLPLLSLALRGAKAERLGLIIVSVLVAHTAWHWLLQRWETLSRITAVDEQAESVVTVLAAMLVAVSLAIVAWPIVRRRSRPAPVDE